MSQRRLFFTGTTLFFLVGAGVAWVLSNQGIIQSSWAPPLGIAFSILGVLVAFVQWTLPLPSSETKASVPSAESGYAQGALYKQIYDRLTEENGALVVYEKRKHVGENISVKPYSSPGSYSSNDKDKKEVNIVERTANGQPLFAAVFLNLKPGEYHVYGAILMVIIDSLTRLNRGKLSEVKHIMHHRKRAAPRKPLPSLSRSGRQESTVARIESF